jgi:hypothetical protein
VKVRLNFSKDESQNRVVNMMTLPRIGERLETGDNGTFIVADVIHTPLSEEQQVVLVLLPDGPLRGPAV